MRKVCILSIRCFNGKSIHICKPQIGQYASLYASLLTGLLLKLAPNNYALWWGGGELRIVHLHM